jgi:hypothetical protein
MWLTQISREGGRGHPGAKRLRDLAPEIDWFREKGQAFNYFVSIAYAEISAKSLFPSVNARGQARSVMLTGRLANLLQKFIINKSFFHYKFTFSYEHTNIDGKPVWAPYLWAAGVNYK